jgi:hypothetical protein
VGIGIRVSGSSTLRIWLGFRGVVQPYIYSPRGWIWALESNQFEVRWKCILGGGGGRLWKLVGISHCGRPGSLGVGLVGPTWQGLVPCLSVVSSRTFLRSSHEIILRSLLIFRSTLVAFCVNYAKNINSPKLVETINLNLLFYNIHPFWSFMQERLMVHDILNYHQH